MPQPSSSTRRSHQNGIPSPETSQNGISPTETSPLSSPLLPSAQSHTHTLVDEEHAHHGIIGSKTCSYVGGVPPAIGHPKICDCESDKETYGTIDEEDVTVKGRTTPSKVRKLCIIP